MGRTDMKKSREELMAACKDMVCAVRENPHAFDGIHINLSNIANDSGKKQIYNFSIISLVLAAIFKAFH